MVGYFINGVNDMTEQAILATLLDQEEEREELVSAIESYIRSIRSGK